METGYFKDVLADILAMPDDGPYGLPGRFFTSNEIFLHEKETVLRSGWHCLGRVDEIPNTGDYFTTSVLDDPVIVVRGKDNNIRVLANVCRHRSMPVAEGAGNRKLFVCSYHAWSYGTEGQLVKAPNMQNACFDQTHCSLPSYTMEIWNGFIYANLGENPSSLLDDLADLQSTLDPYELENYRVVHVGEETWHCNWKALVENFMEGYHLSVVHPQTLHGYTPTQLCKKGPSGRAFTSYHANYPREIEPRGQGAAGLSQEQKYRSTLFAAFPTQVVSVSASLLVSLCIQPEETDRITVRWTMSVYKDDLSDETIKDRIALWNDVNREDREKLERLQQALLSSKAEAGPLAGDDFEGTIRDFHKFIARSHIAQGAVID